MVDGPLLPATLLFRTILPRIDPVTHIRHPLGTNSLEKGRGTCDQKRNRFLFIRALLLTGRRLRGRCSGGNVVQRLSWVYNTQRPRHFFDLPARITSCSCNRSTELSFFLLRKKLRCSLMWNIITAIRRNLSYRKLFMLSFVKFLVSSQIVRNCRNLQFCASLHFLIVQFSKSPSEKMSVLFFVICCTFSQHV